MKIQVTIQKGPRKREIIFRDVVRFKIINGSNAGKEFERKCSRRCKNSFPTALMPGSSAQFRLGKKIGEDFYEVEQVTLC